MSLALTLNRPSSRPSTRVLQHSKMATGENIHGLYGDTRLDQAWHFREAFAKAAELRDKQDAWCATGKANADEFPVDNKWEALADALRGNLRTNVHTYMTHDIGMLVQLSNEFKFELAAVHHAHEAYLVPETLKKAYGTTPAAAIFATNARYKLEALRGSEFAPKLLADAGISVVMKSDHPVPAILHPCS
jgi:imidazolonepropionase-like amidohydrolase